MNIRLEGKVIIVTGSTQGVGEATARIAAESGAAAVMIRAATLDAAEP